MARQIDSTPGAVISIVGRPNVGKSAIFNRIARERIAIVFDQPGVTRDRVAREVSACGRRFLLIDTGGLAFGDTPGAEDPLAAETRQQAALAVSDSAVCVVVVDVRAGVTPLDEEVIKRVRESGVPCVIAANKCDNPEDDQRADDFARFGLEVFAVSAEHSRGMQNLIKTLVSRLPPAKEEETKNALRVAIVGRPNAGKSSYINRLLNEDRVIVSDIPGTTRDAVDVPFTIGEGETARHYVLVDTAGIKKHTQMSKTSVDNFSLFRTEKAIEEADVVLLVMESELGPTRQDMRIANKIIEAKRACVILMNKWDIANSKGMKEKESAEALRKMMPFLSFAPLVFCSAKSGYNIRRTVDAIDAVASSVKTVMPTALLNRTLVAATKRTQAPMIGGKRLKVYYGLQVGTDPLTVRLFVNDPKLTTDAYLSYLEKNIRSRFGLEGAPLLIEPKARARKDGAMLGVEIEKLKRTSSKAEAKIARPRNKQKPVNKSKPVNKRKPKK
ncbi:MAG: ribosome biogenesis GTPase Der [Kiritimatiellae bacterium]|nr:ribosome biogenesis GTPase Der [Kiritimatiellia bacterium]